MNCWEPAIAWGFRDSEHDTQGYSPSARSPSPPRRARRVREISWTYSVSLREISGFIFHPAWEPKCVWLRMRTLKHFQPSLGNPLSKQYRQAGDSLSVSRDASVSLLDFGNRSRACSLGWRGEGANDSPHPPAAAARAERAGVRAPPRGGAGPSSPRPAARGLQRLRRAGGRDVPPQGGLQDPGAAAQGAPQRRAAAEGRWVPGAGAEEHGSFVRGSRGRPSVPVCPGWANPTPSRNKPAWGLGAGGGGEKQWGSVAGLDAPKFLKILKVGNLSSGASETRLDFLGSNLDVGPVL